MSSLNKSFIKAYRKSAAAGDPPKAVARPHFAPPARAAQDPAKVLAEPVTASSPTGPTAAPARGVAAGISPHELPRPHAAPAAAPALPEKQTDVIGPDAAQAEKKPLAIAEPVQRTVVDRPHVGVRPPHAKFAEAPRRAPSARADSAVSPTSSSQPAVSVLDATVSPRPVILPISGPSPIWRPVFEVANFTWPELTDVLLDAAGAQFRAAASDLAEACRRHRKLVSVTAARRGEGCTIIALALAKALADQQQRVILVDAHFEAPGLADNLGLSVQVGLEDALTGEKPLVEALVESLEDRVVVLPLRQSATADWRLSIARLKSSLDELRRHCDVVLIDAGPVGDTSDRRRLLSWAAPCRVDRALVVRDLPRPATKKRPRSNGVCTAVALPSGISWKTSPPPRNESHHSLLHPRESMYEAYWQLQQKPFAVRCDARSYYPTETHQGALLKLRYAIENRCGAALLIGSSGCGKTLLARLLAEQLPETYRPAVHLVFPQMPAGDLLAYVAAELAQRPSAKRRRRRSTSACAASSIVWRKSRGRDVTPSWPSTRRT